MSPARRKLTLPSGLSILTGSGPICGNAGSFPGSGPKGPRGSPKAPQLPALLESGAQALVGGAERRFADRARNADATEQFLLGADFTKPFVVGGGQRLAGRKTGAGIRDAQFGRLVGFVIARRAADDAGHRDDALLDQIVAVLQRERILLVERQRFAERRAELALLLRRIEPGFDRGLVPDRTEA